jgi:hypothetical protein
VLPVLAAAHHTPRIIRTCTMTLSSPFAASGEIVDSGIALGCKTVFFVVDAECSYAPRQQFSPQAVAIFDTDPDSGFSSQSSLASTPRELNLSRRASFSSDGVREIDELVQAGEYDQALTKIDDGTGELKNCVVRFE